MDEKKKFDYGRSMALSSSLPLSAMTFGTWGLYQAVSTAPSFFPSRIWEIDAAQEFLKRTDDEMLQAQRKRIRDIFDGIGRPVEKEKPKPEKAKGNFRPDGTMKRTLDLDD